MRKSVRFLAVGLAASLLLSAGAYAAPDVEKRREDAQRLYTGLKENHPILFANTLEVDFLAKLAEIEGRAATVSDLDFALDLQGLATLTGDAHTTTSIGGAGHAIFPAALEIYEGKWVLSVLPQEESGWLGGEVLTVNGYSMADIVEKFRPIVSHDNDVKLMRQVKQMFYVQDVLTYLGVTEAGGELVLALRRADGTTGELRLTALSVEEQGTAKLARLKDMRAGTPATEADRSRTYFALPLDERTYYIQYNQCREDAENPMEDFARAVQANLDAGSYTKVLLDLRNNGGGSDGVIAPLLDLLKDRVWSGEVKLFALTGEQTFSSAGINASMLQDMGGLTAGGPTGGSVDHFGAVRGFALPHSGIKVSHSTKFIDLEELLITAAGLGVEPLRPDVAVEQTLGDYLAGRDTVVDYLLRHGDAIAAPVRANAETTRAGYVAKLWREAGSPAAATVSDFADIPMFFAYYVPALNWAAEQGIVLGDGAGSFRPADPVSEAERNLMAQRAAALAG